MKLTAELSRFKVKQGKMEAVEQWMAFLNDHMGHVLLTLDDEKMFVETIFKGRRSLFVLVLGAGRRRNRIGELQPRSG